MSPLVLVVGSAVLYLVAYHTYGRWLGRKVFRLEAGAEVPSVALRDDRDFVPTSRWVVFGHHFTSIAGTGPIVGPALAIMWGWVPAMVWVVLGPIFLGAVHDFSTLVVSLRSQGRSVGEVAGRVMGLRASLLFLVVLLFALWVVLAIFGWVIASVFVQFPEAILPVFLQIPISLWIGGHVHRRGGHLLVPSLLALGVMFVTVWLGAGCPGWGGDGGWLGSSVRGVNGWLAGWPIWVWVAVLLGYCYLASVLPVWLLLQPRDYINSLQLVATMGLLVCGVVVVSLGGWWGLAGERLEMVAPAVRWSPVNAPAIFPFLFVTVACGAISGFHCLVSSGTSSKQLMSEGDAQFVGYGAMLLEGFLAVLVVVAVGAGIGMGWQGAFPGLLGSELWSALYSDWKGVTGGRAIGAFVVGAGNLIERLGVDATMAKALLGVLVASFAGTTLDTATRLQRYVVQELAGQVGGKVKGGFGAVFFCWVGRPHAATMAAVVSAFFLAILPAPGRPWSWENLGTGGLLLWPLFGATNQLLGGLAFLVVTLWLRARGMPVVFTALPMGFMVLMPAWALGSDLVNWVVRGELVLVVVGVSVLALAGWLVVEAVVAWGRSPMGGRAAAVESAGRRFGE